MLCPNCHEWEIGPNSRCVKCGHKPEGVGDLSGKYVDGVKVSDHTSLGSSIFWDPNWDHKGHYSESLGVHLRSKGHKRDVMKRQNCSEAA